MAHEPKSGATATAITVAPEGARETGGMNKLDRILDSTIRLEERVKHADNQRAEIIADVDNCNRILELTKESFGRQIAELRADFLREINTMKAEQTAAISASEAYFIREMGNIRRVQDDAVRDVVTAKLEIANARGFISGGRAVMILLGASVLSIFGLAASAIWYLLRAAR